MGLKDDILEKEIIDTVTNKPKRGFLLARFDRIERSTNLTISFQGESLASKRFCGANNNMLEIYKPKNIHTISQTIGNQKGGFDYLSFNISESEWVLVERTEHINRNDLAKWPDFKIQKSKLCSSNDDIPLLFKVMDYKTNSGNHKLVGATILTLNEIRNGQSALKQFQLFKKGRQNRGFLKATVFKEGKL
jgi:hypothetical protein